MWDLQTMEKLEKEELKRLEEEKERIRQKIGIELQAVIKQEKETYNTDTYLIFLYGIEAGLKRVLEIL